MQFLVFMLFLTIVLLVAAIPFIILYVSHKVWLEGQETTNHVK